jgi:hypothetical protein
MSPPVSPVAKSAHRPVSRLTLNDPARLSVLVGFVAIHSSPTRLPCGSHRETSIGVAGIEAAFTAGKFTLGLTPEKAFDMCPISAGPHQYPMAGQHLQL